MLVFLMRRRPPRSTRTDTLFPYTPLFRSRQLYNENFDVPAIGRFVIGRYWRTASPADQKAFLKVFEDAMVQRFLPLLAENSSESFQVGRPEESRVGKKCVSTCSIGWSPIQ